MGIFVLAYEFHLISTRPKKFSKLQKIDLKIAQMEVLTKYNIKDYYDKVENYAVGTSSPHSLKVTLKLENR